MTILFAKGTIMRLNGQYFPLVTWKIDLSVTQEPKEKEQMNNEAYRKALHALNVAGLEAKALEGRLLWAANLAFTEARRGAEKFKPFNSPHEGFAILKEEVDELWEEVKCNDIEAAREEAVQVAATALRFLADCH